MDSFPGAHNDQDFYFIKEVTEALDLNADTSVSLL